MTKQTIRIRRIGSVTFGIVLIAMGILFLSHLLFPEISYEMIYRFWPVILILLGLEVLAGARQRMWETVDEKGNIIEQSKTVYDVPAILMMLFLTLFSVCMGFLDFCFTARRAFP